MTDNDRRQGANRRTPFGKLSLLAMAACTSTAPPVITSAADLHASDGKLVRLHGPVFHEKLGDGITLDGTSILCPDLRLTTTHATLTGRLELWSPPVATTDASGNISQGVTTPTRRWILRDCRQD